MMGISVWKELLGEVICSVVFVYTAYTMPTIQGAIVYFFVYIFYLGVGYNTLRQEIMAVAGFVRGESRL